MKRPAALHCVSQRFPSSASLRPGAIFDPPLPEPLPYLGLLSEKQRQHNGPLTSLHFVALPVIRRVPIRPGGGTTPSPNPSPISIIESTCGNATSSVDPTCPSASRHPPASGPARPGTISPLKLPPLLRKLHRTQRPSPLLCASHHPPASGAARSGCTPLPEPLPS